MEMGLDLGFYKDGEEILYFRNHWDLIQLFHPKEEDYHRPSDDFTVSERMFVDALRAVEDQMMSSGIPFPILPARTPRLPKEFEQEVPEYFCHEEPEDWEAALPHYRILLTRLLEMVRREGPLICGWSA